MKTINYTPFATPRDKASDNLNNGLKVLNGAIK